MTTEELIKRIQNEKKSVRDSLYNSEGLLRLQTTMENYDGEYKLISSDEILEEIKNRPRSVLHQTGITGLDNLIGGFKEQQMIGLAAHSGHGKTAMGLFLMEQLKDLNPVMIPLEQSNEELIEQRYDNGQFIPHFFSPRKHSARVKPEWIEERVVEGIAKHNSRIMVIDHLGYIDAESKYDRDPDHLRIERKLQAIKNVAKKWNVIIIVLIHTTQTDEGIPLSLVNLKGSAAIRQECDTVILLWRKNYQKKKIRVYKNETLLSVQKNRRTGKNGNVGLMFEPETGRYVEDNSWVEAMEKAALQEVESEEMFDEYVSE